MREIRLLYVREIRSALRERSIVVQSLLVPLLVYPLMIWLMFAGVTFVRGQQDATSSRIAVDPLPEAHAELRERLAEDERFELLDDAAESDAADTDEAIRAGEVDLLVRIVEAEPSAFFADNFSVRLVLDASKDRSATAAERFREALDDYRSDLLEAEGRARGLGDREWLQARIETEDLASGSELGAFVLGLVVPMLMVIMIAQGCLMPAIDATAGERERETWETLMTTGASRGAVLIAKYLYVATFGAAAGLINLFALSVSMAALVAPMLGDEGLEFELPIAALPLIALGSLLLALFIAAGMLLLASFARSFKEGQSMTAPFYMLILLPAMLVSPPDLTLDPLWAVVPVANVALLFRAAISGPVDPVLVALVLGSTAGLAAACVALARWVLSFEDVLVGSYGGSLPRLIKERLGRRAQRSTEGAQ